MAFQYKNDLSAGINTDLNETKLPPTVAQFLKNLTSEVNANAGSPAGAGYTLGNKTPLEGNQELSNPIVFPAGDNYVIGSYSSEQTNELYFFVYNDLGNNTVWVISGDSGLATLVFQDNLTFDGVLLSFSLDPEFWVAEGRCTLEVVSYTDPIVGELDYFKFLIFTLNNDIQYWISVTDSIATTSYTTAYFSATASFYDRKTLIHLGVPTPINPINDGGAFPNQPIKVLPVPYSAPYNLQNYLIRYGWQFRVSIIDVFGRESEHGIISDQYISMVGGGCLQESNELPRCVNLSFDAGNPLANFFKIEYRKWIANGDEYAIESNWMLYDTICKWNEPTVPGWYSRTPNITYWNTATNIITYKFCAEKGNAPIDPAETARTEPELPLISSGLTSANKSLILSNNVRGFNPLLQTEIQKVSYYPSYPTSTNCQAAKTANITVYACIVKPFVDLNPTQAAIHATGFIWYTSSGFFGSGQNKYVFGFFRHHVSGYSSTVALCDGSNPFTMDQVFADQSTPGFIGYLAGTNNFAICDQGWLNPTSGAFTSVAMNVLEDWFAGPGYISPPTSGMVFVMRFRFINVVRGKYVFRLASHHSKSTVPNYQQTSTTVLGVASIGDALTIGARMTSCSQNPIKEIELDCSSGDINLHNASDPVLCIADLTSTDGNAADGYYYEDNIGGVPIEMNPVYGANINGHYSQGDVIGSFYTDHNGYFFLQSISWLKWGIYSDICNGNNLSLIYYNTLHFYQSSGYAGCMQHGDGTLPGGVPASSCSSLTGFWFNKLYCMPNGVSYPDCARRHIKFIVQACGGSLGIPGVPVVMTKGQAGVTGVDGTVTLIAHSRYTYCVNLPISSAFSMYDPAHYNNNPCNAFLVLVSNVPDYGSSSYNTDYLVIGQKGGCAWFSCTDCTVTSIADILIAYLACCSPCVVGCRDVLLGPIFVSMFGINLKGCQSGGRYQMAFILHDSIGRHTFAQVADGEAAFVNFPNLNDQLASPPPGFPYPAFVLSQIGFTIAAGFKAQGFSRLTFAVSQNKNFSDFISWQADWVQYVDNTGTTNSVAPTGIRIYYGSLNEYNKQYNFNTNSVWQVQANGQIANPNPLQVNTPSMQVGDIVQFIQNGPLLGSPNVVSAPITFDQPGLFFTVDYNNTLNGLWNGCLFRIIRPRTVQNDTIYYEQNYCLNIDTDGYIVGSSSGTTPISGILPYFDSYLLSRVIPVPVFAVLITPGNASATPQVNPVLAANTGLIPPGGTLPSNIATTSNINPTAQPYSTSNPNANNVIIMWGTDIQQSYSFLFESPSPSDLWGSHLINQGRIMFANPNEMQRRIGTEIAPSAALSDRGSYNGLSYFESKNAYVFDRNQFGNITVCLTEVGKLLVICDSDHFITMYNQQQLKVTASGYVNSQNAYGIFTQPERISGTPYGCEPNYINTISKYNGTVLWVDKKGGHIILSNFSTSQPLEIKNEYSSYMLQKIASMNNIGIYNGRVFHGRIDPKKYEYNLTSWFLPEKTRTPTYINKSTDVSLYDNENIIVDILTGLLKCFTSYTPEYFGQLPGYIYGKNFISFKQGQPWVHHQGVGTAVPYNNFYGIQCESIIKIVCNPSPEKVKRYLYIEVYTSASIGGGTGLFEQPLFICNTNDILTEKGQLSRLLEQQWDIRDNYTCSAFLCDVNTPIDPNLPLQTGAHVIRDGNQLIGRWMKVRLTTQASYTGTFFEISAICIYVNGVQKSDGNK